MLFRRKGALSKTSFFLLLFLAAACGQTQSQAQIQSQPHSQPQSQAPTQSNARSYDTNDWIPVSRPVASGEGTQVDSLQKRPTGRVLNLPSHDEKRYFPTEQQFVVPQQYRLSSEAMKHLVSSQRPIQQQPTFVPNGQQQILLPPQLQSLIAQDQSYLSPQKINSHLLQPQSYSPLPTQSFPLNLTTFSPRDVPQNINLALYNQQAIKQQGHHVPIQQQQQQSIKQQNTEQPEVQLLYVPLENLQTQRGQRQQLVFPTEQAVAVPQIYKTLQPQQYQSPVQHKQVQLQNIEQEFVQQALQAQKLQEQFQHNIQPVTQQSIRRPFIPDVISQSQTIQAPKKRKPHQPPLAVYMGAERQQEVKIGDVLSLLKEAKTISVQDSVGPDSPQVFVGPSHLEAPEGYVKFELPYLSNIENNRVERKVEQLPFFVAPLSYKAPAGYSKIPFPAPHVGSVIINHLKATPATTTENTKFIPSHTLEETKSYIPFSQPEVSTIRATRGRQRLPLRNNFPASTLQTPASDNIPYGPLPTKIPPEVQQPHSIQGSLVSSNPYGPTQYVQSTTSATYDKPTDLSEQIFSTKNRFSTASPTYSTYNIQDTPTKQNLYTNRPEVKPTEPTLASSTLSGSLINDKYTILEQFPISGKLQQTSEAVQHRLPTRHQSRRPVQETYQEDSAEKAALPLIASPQISSQHIESQTSYGQLVQDVPIKYRTTETYPKQRFAENYELAFNVPQSSPVQQMLSKEQISTSQSPQDFEVPIRQSQPQIRGQQTFLNENYEFTSQGQPQRLRGKQHFTPEQYYQEEYQQQVTQKSSEPLITVTKEPVIEYKIPEEQRHHESGVRGQHHQQQTITDAYYREQETVPSKQEYTLPAKLPPISPQLPGLINSLQDQQLRPLLAPLLLPPSEQPPVEESSPDSREEYYSSTKSEPELVHVTPSTTTTTTTTTTLSPNAETTTQFKRTRSRQRGTRPTPSYDYVSTTPSSKRPTQYRGRRPYTAATRQEFKPRENYPFSSTTEVESTTRAVYNRNRQVPVKQYVSSTTEHPKRTPTPSRQRFRTRGRPAKSEEEYAERNEPDNYSSFKQPVLESGFQVSAPLLQQNVQLTLPTSHTDSEGNVADEPINQRQKEQALIFIQNSNKPIIQEPSPLPDLYIPRQQISSTKSLEPIIHHSTIAATGPESNFVPDIVHDQPTLLSTQQQIRVSSPVEVNTNSHEDYNSKEETNVQIPQIKYNSEPDIKEQSTTEFTRSRTRTRGKTRTRINPVASTTRYHTTSPTTHRTTTEAKQEEREEFYGFFRQPNFAKPKTEPPPTNPPPRPTVTYLSRATEEPQQQRFFSSPENSPRTYLPITNVEDSYADPNNQRQQYISSTVFPVSSSEESDVKPITRRPIVRARRPNATPVRTSDLISDTPDQSEKYYVRPTKRPEILTTKSVRIRGRIRVPSRVSTTKPEIESSYSHSPRTNELDNNHFEETSTQVKTRQRLTSRGKSHFQLPKNEKVSEESEEENYPTSFLQNRGIHAQSQSSSIIYSASAASTQQPIVLTTSGAVTPRPVFQLTIEPEDAEEEYPDQVPYSSITQPKISNKDLEQGGEESKFSAKVVEKPVNFNYIVSENKLSSSQEPTTEKAMETEISESSSTTTEYNIQKEDMNDVASLTTSINDETTQYSDTSTTDLSSTTEEFITDKPKSRRRGTWRLVRTRPLGDEFESAESQNVQTIFNDNELTHLEKPIRKYKIVQRIRTTTEPIQEETTTVNIPETTYKQQNEVTTIKHQELSSTTESLFASLYEMFGYNSESENSEINDETEVTTTENPTMFNTQIEEESITASSNNSTETPLNNEEQDKLSFDIMQGNRDESSLAEDWQRRIIGTSTTTEISHETEICYRGRCVKSASTEDSSDERL